MKEIDKEGIAVDIENAIAVFKKEIEVERKLSGRLFDQDLNNKDRVYLDAGCGIGRHLLILRNNDIKNFFGFDILSRLILIAKEEFDLQNTFVANALRIPLAGSSVDRCLLYNTIEHCSEPKRVLKEVLRILKKGGVLYMDVPNAKSVGDRIFRWGGILVYGKTSHIQKFTKKSFELLIGQIGFHIVECKIKRGIFIDYQQLQRFSLIKKFVKFLFGNEVSGWEFKLKKKQ